MRAMILAAGRGARMGGLTDELPKPLLKINGQPLIEYALRSLVKIGIKDIIINVSYQAALIEKTLGNGERFGVKLHYSYEETALETGGGICQALPLLGDGPFIAMSSDIVTDFPLAQLPVNPDGLAHLLLVPNPDFHPEGDFCLYGQRVYYGEGQTYNYGGIGVYRPEFFNDCPAGKFSLGKLFNKEILNQKVTGQLYKGYWQNIGTAAQLSAADQDFPRELFF
jgi:MurNAc alpha-1-phosphate uridylyltransferase